jgi:hypothetical protein
MRRPCALERSAGGGLSDYAAPGIQILVRLMREKFVTITPLRRGLESARSMRRIL